MKNLADDGQPISSHDAGFTLLEVLVALTIAALGLGALVAATGQGLSNVTAADRFIDATRRAQSHMAMVGISEQLAPGDSSGDDGAGYVWRVTVEPIAAHPPRGKTNPKPIGLYLVDVSISWREKGRTKSVSLQSERIRAYSGSHG